MPQHDPSYEGEQDHAGLCLLIVVGCKSAEFGDLIMSPRDVHNISSSRVSKVVAIPDDDEFELSKAMESSSNAGAEIAEIYASHSHVEYLLTSDEEVIAPGSKRTSRPNKRSNDAILSLLRAGASRESCQYVSKLLGNKTSDRWPAY